MRRKVFPRSASRIENNLFILNERLVKEKEALEALREQADTLAQMAEEGRIRALVSDTLFDKEQADATRRHAELALQNVDKAYGMVLKLEREREELLKKLL